MNRFTSYLEPVTHFALIGAAVAISWTYWSPAETNKSEDSPLGSRNAPTIQTDSSKALSTWRSSEERIFLFVSPSCPFTTLSMDFYARLSRVVDSMQNTGDPVAIAAVIDSSTSRRLQNKMLRSSDVKVDTLLSTPLSAVGATSVPIVSLPHPHQENRATWIGLQDAAGEKEILSTVQGLAASP